MKHNRNAYRWSPNRFKGVINALIGVFFAFCIRYALHPYLQDNLPLFFFQINTIIIAFFYGLIPAIFTLIFSVPLISYFFMAPFGSFTVFDTRDVNLLAAYISYTALVGLIIEWLRREQFNAKMAGLVSETRFKLMVEGDNKIRELIKNPPPTQT